MESKQEDWKVSRELAEEMFGTIPGLSSKFELELIACNVLTYHSEVHTQFWMSVVMKHLSNEEQKWWRTGKYTEEQ